MKNKKGKSGYLVLLFVPALIGFILIMGRVGRNSMDKVSRMGVETVGILSSTVGEHMKVEYEANGKIYIKGEREPFVFLQDGEMYVVKYIPDDSRIYSCLL